MLVLNKHVKPIVLLTNKHLLKAFYVADMGLRQKEYRATKNLVPSFEKSTMWCLVLRLAYWVLLFKLQS